MGIGQILNPHYYLDNFEKLHKLNLKYYHYYKYYHFPFKYLENSFLIKKYLILIINNVR